MSKAKETVRHGGYVDYGIRKRKTVEMYVEVDYRIDVSDCGPGTDKLVKLLEAKAARLGLRNVEVREVW